MRSDLERTLLLALMAANLDSGGEIRVKNRLWTATYHVKGNHRTGFGCLNNDKIEGTWNEAEGAAQNALFICKSGRVKWDDIILYPKDDDQTGVPWRMLKLDMPFLRIVLLKDEAALFAITRRLASIMDKALTEGLGMKPPEPELN